MQAAFFCLRRTALRGFPKNSRWLAAWLLLVFTAISGGGASAQVSNKLEQRSRSSAKPRPPEEKPKYANAPKKALSLYADALELIDKRRFEDALEPLGVLNAKYPSFAQPWLRRGSVLLGLARKREAYESYKRGVKELGYNAEHAADYVSAGNLAMEFGDYTLARQAFEALLKANPRNRRGIDQAQRQLQNVEFAEQQLAHPAPDLHPTPLPDNINQFRFHYFPVVTADGRELVYTARRGNQDTDDENLFIARRNPGGEFGEPRSISPLINSPYNEGAAAISGDGKTLVFTSCNRPDSRGDCDLYYARLEGGHWSRPANLGPTVNSASWDSQPTLSADGRTLYFASARKGGLGNEDIYVTTLNEDNNWAPARNLGAPINSAARDMAPFLHASGSTLYFATDGPVGMGGLDLFRAERKTGGGWAKPQNLGYPLNTFEDENSIFIPTDNRIGYYSHGLNRLTTDFAIKLYSFEVPKQARSFERSAVAQGRVFDAETKKTLAATVQLYDLVSDELVESVSSDKEDGQYTVVLTEGHQYAMYATADNYLIKSLTFDYTGQQTFDPLTLDIYLDPVKAGASLVLNNLFFPTNAYELEKKSKTELDRLTRYLTQYATLAVEISGHTDDVGSDATNLTLSENRAKAVYDYLTKNGIKTDRLKFKGYGETRPAVPNTTEGNRQLNRRIELIVL